MATIRVEAQVSTDELLRAVEQIPEQDLETFVAQVLALRAQRAAPHLGVDESALLVRINTTLSQPLQQRYDVLVAKRRADTLTPSEQRELIELTDQIEQQDAERLEALTELAQIRQTSVTQLMQTLGIRPPAYV